MMKAASFVKGCAPEAVTLAETAIPALKSGQVLIKVVGTAINRADTLQRRGLYPAPKGVSDILGLEASGVVVEQGNSKWNKGDRVMALLAGGGNAEFVAAKATHLLHVPQKMDLVEAAAIPEVWLTAYQLLTLADVKSGETVLVHAGASGVGTALVQLVEKLFRAKTIATMGSDEKCQFLRRLLPTNPPLAVNYKTTDFAETVKRETEGRGVNVVFDSIGASYVEKNADCLASDGRWLIYGLMGGVKLPAESNLLLSILRKRLRIQGTTLRARHDEYKTKLVADFERNVLPLFERGDLKAVVDRTLPFDQIGAAHSLIESNQTIGKVLLKISDDNP